ncbi:MAG: sterol desaturase family protein [Pseudomonadota bacterium]
MAEPVADLPEQTFVQSALKRVAKSNDVAIANKESRVLQPERYVNHAYVHDARSRFLWSLPQPILVLGSMLAIATAITTEWVDADLFTTFMILLPLPLFLLAERYVPKRTDWILEPKELAEDAFWLAGAAFIWVPLYSDYYETPISWAFEWLRDVSTVPFTLNPETTLGLILAALFVRATSEFIYYWLHRIQHETLFWWRIHATHHHITKMSAARGDRTHPLEWLALSLGTPIVLALFGATDDVIAVTGAFGFFNGICNHSNLPLVTNKLYGLFFSTASMHHVHHAHDMEYSNKNYGCSIIIWDRIFGTYLDVDMVDACGAGKGEALDLKTQYALAFYSDEELKQL